MTVQQISGPIPSIVGHHGSDHTAKFVVDKGNGSIQGTLNVYHGGVSWRPDGSEDTHYYEWQPFVKLMTENVEAR